MSLLFVDGCSHYASGDFTKKWGTYFAGVVTETNPRRPGSKSITAEAYFSATTPVFSSPKSRVIAACAVRVQGYFRIDLMIGAGETQVQLVRSGDTLSVNRGNAQATLRSINTEGIIGAGEWYYFEFGVTIHDTAGTIEVRLNGTPLSGLTASGLDTKASTSAGVDRVAFYPGGSSSLMTDIYVDDATFHGDCIVETLYPFANGSHAAWTPSAGTNYENVDDPGDIDDDATYNATPVQDAKDTFLHTALSSRPGSAIKGLALHCTARKDWAGSRVLKPMLAMGGLDFVHAEDGLILSDVYHGTQRFWPVNPQTGASWNETAINAAEIGYDLVVGGN